MLLAQASNLSESCHARPDAEAMLFPRGVSSRARRRFRAGPYQAHVADQHIPQLGKFRYAEKVERPLESCFLNRLAMHIEAQHSKLFEVLTAAQVPLKCAAAK